MPYTYKFPHPSITADVVIFAMHENDLKVLLVQRKNPPYKNHWAIPGGFVEIDEDLELGARRELEEETGVKNVFLEQLYTFGAAGRDPRGRVITVAYYALLSVEFAPLLRAGDDAREVMWHPVVEAERSQELALAFDHREIIRVALERVRGKIDYDPRLVRALLPDEFTQSEFRRVHETIKGARYDKSNFSKRFRRMLEDGRFEATDEKRALRGAGRPPKLYRFVE